VLQVAAEAIEAPDHEDIEPTPPRIPQEGIEGGPAILRT
jgi:hypothetical protein